MNWFNRFPLPFASTLLLLTILLVPFSASAEWKAAGQLAIPKQSYAFLAATPNGSLLATTFHSVATNAPPKAIPALLIENPTSPAPTVRELCRVEFPPQRGYGGIACDPSGAFFVSGDTGDPQTCFVSKFLPSGEPYRQFGTNGEIRPRRRTLGLDVFGNYLLVAVDWGEIQIFAADTGRYLTAVPGAPGKPFLRDIAIDPKSMRIFGVAAGAVMTWGSGAPWNPGAYQYRLLSQPYGEQRAGEGICINPFDRTLLVTPKPGNVLFEVDGTLRVNRYTIESAKPTTHLADSVVSFDGSTVFISDMTGLTIHMMKRTGAAPALIASAPSGTRTAPFKADASIPAPTWGRSYQQAVQPAREAHRPMLVYFRQDGVAKAQQLESTVLQSPEFYNVAKEKQLVCVWEDTSKDRLTAYRFGAYRVPHMVVLDRQGETAAEFTYDIDANALLSALSDLK